MTVKERVQALREKMKASGVAMYVVPSTDCHESEYVSEHFRARAFITGFTGSAGTAVIAQDDAGLWTDGRYFLQAEAQLQGTGIRLFRMGEPGVPTVEEYIQEHLEKGEKLGFDGRVMGASRALAFAKAAEENGASLFTEEDLIGEIWADRPEVPDADLFVLEEKWSGETTDKKLARVRKAMEEKGADLHVLASLCDIAWLLNIRGGDIPCVPVVLSFLTVTKKECIWYVRPSVITERIRNYVADFGIAIKGYDEIYGDLKKVPAGSKVLLDQGNVNYRLLTSIPEEAEVLNCPNPTELMKAVKNETEQKNLHQSHLKEGVAFTRFMYWLKTKVGKEKITEISAAEHLAALRSEQKDLVELSFSPICGYGEHGAIVHYSATEESDVELKPESFFLVDAGGHYLDGTTDTTRTFAMGPLTDEQKKMYTAVLRGNLNLSHARFLKGCSGYNLDVICRTPLWQIGMDYKHGTGHGVGYLLNVHEGPNTFRWKLPEGANAAELEPGMVTTDEPGIYLEGKYGIRLENELLCVEGPKNEYGQFLEFEILTLIPWDLDAVDPAQMTEQERTWLNEYHHTVYEAIAPHLPKEEQEWLAYATRAI